MIHSTHSSAPESAPRPVAPRRPAARKSAFQSVTQRPLLIFGVLAVAFLAWVASDATDAVPTAPAPVPEAGNVSRMRAVGYGLHQLRAGMSRAEVESQLGRPATRDIRPIERSNGRVVYRTHYPAYLTEPLALAPGVQGNCEAVLEYDAAAPGHPLLRVTAVPVGPLTAQAVAHV